MSNDSEAVNADHSPENGVNASDVKKIDASSKASLVAVLRARVDGLNEDSANAAAYAVGAPGRRLLSALASEYEAKILPHWQSYVNDFSKRAGEVTKRATERVEAIRRVASERLESISQVSSKTEGEIRSRYKRTAPNADISIHAITFFETLKLPSFVNHWWKVGLGTLILIWIIVNFDFAVICSLGGIAGFAFWLQKQQHDKVQSRRNALDEEQELYQIEQRKAAEERAELAASAAAERAELEASKEGLLAEHNSKYSEEKAPFTAEWSKKCTTFNKEVSDFESRLQDALGAVGSRFAAFADDDPLHEDIEDLDEQLSFRIGDRAMPGPQKLDKDLGYEFAITDRPTSLDTRIPIFFDLASRRALMVEGGSTPSSKAVPNIFENVMTRILRQIPPGKATFTLIDPLGLGSNFAPFLKLQDYSENLINGTVWTNRDQIKRRLQGVIEHIETVTQKYLRADYPDIESYNREAQDIAEAYRFICLADFPEGFDEDAVRDLVKIIQNGPRCGVHTLIYRNENVKPAYGINLDELLQSCMVLSATDGHGTRRRMTVPGKPSIDLTLDLAQKPAQLKKLVDSFGAGAVDAMKVEVPFSALFGLAKLGEDKWTGLSTEGISVPLGPKGAKKAMMMTLDSRLSHNALIVGRPGSGKSNLLHVFISMVCQRYSPDEVELYLIDFKKGVEFKDYANSLLPHARVIAVESEREFGLSVLKALDKEMSVRAELFKRADAAENISEYRKHMPEARMPRAVLIVDEFQEFFTREDKIKNEATLLFDRIVRQGRSFGVHVILGTQSLANSGLPRSTIDQIPIRIALQCSEADSRLILADDNIVARGLTRPGEAIYNSKAGLIEGNDQFQVALFGGSERKAQLAKLMDFVTAKGWQGDPPRIFEGHESAQLMTCKSLLSFKPVPATASLKTWLGEPVSLDDPVHASLSPQAGRNMMVISREEEQGANVILSALTSLITQLPPRDLNIHVVDLTTADAPWADYPESLRDAMPHKIEVCGRQRMRDLLPELRELVKQRHATSDAQSDTNKDYGPRTVLAIIGAHRARELRPSEEMGAFSFDAKDADAAPELSACLKEIVTDGPDVGVHTMLWLDSYTNFERIFDRRVLGEFGIRVSGALPEKDSHTLYDNQIAAQIAHPNRMVKFDDDLVGVYVMFRPYAVNSEAVFGQIRDRVFAKDVKGD